MRRGYVVFVALASCSEPTTPAPPVVREVPVVATPVVEAPVVEAPVVTTPVPQVPVVEAAVVAPEVAPAEDPGFPTAITTRGIGPFGPGLKGDLKAIRRLVPGLAVTSRHDESEAHDIEEIKVSRARKPVLTMILNHYRLADPLFTITAKDPMFATGTGIAVGSTVKDLTARHPDTVCVFEEYDPSLDVLAVERRMYCEASDLPNISFELDARLWKGRTGRIASAGIAERAIVAIVWRAP